MFSSPGILRYQELNTIVMAISILETPNIAGANGYAASTAQLRYSMTTDQFAQDKYRLSAYISELDLQLYYLPNSSGALIFDIGEAISQMLFRNENTYIYYRLTLTEEWQGSAEASTFSAYTLAVVSKRQILSSNGSNLIEYVTEGSGKFLSVFEYPRIWEGYASKASIINLTETTVKFIATTLDINKTTIAATTTAKTIAINEIQEERLSHEARPSYYLQVQYTDNLDVAISEQKLFKLEPACRNSMMIEWVNTLGGVERWLFMYEQAVTNISDAGISYSSPIVENIANVTGNKFRASGNDTQYLVLKADKLSADDLRGLHDIKNSDQVRLLLSGESMVDPTEITTNSEFTTDITGWTNVDHPVLGAGGTSFAWSAADGGSAYAIGTPDFSTGLSQTLTIKKGFKYMVEIEMIEFNDPSDKAVYFVDDLGNYQILFNEEFTGTNIQTATVIADADYTSVVHTSDIVPPGINTQTAATYFRLFEYPERYVDVRVNNLYQTDYTTGKGNYEFSLSVELPDNFDYFKA